MLSCHRATTPNHKFGGVVENVSRRENVYLVSGGVRCLVGSFGACPASRPCSGGAIRAWVFELVGLV